MTVQKVGVIGCTGSVGTAVVDVCRAYPERFRLTVLGAGHGGEKLAALGKEFRFAALAAANGDGADPSLKLSAVGREMEDLFVSNAVDHLVIASSGVSAVRLLDRALKLGKTVSLANKESAVLLGPSISGPCLACQLRPLDSEHNAVWQCLKGEKSSDVKKIWLTASGGPFLRRDLSSFGSITPQEAVSHPVWSMGAKISVDSATMINKGIEVIEASYLFGLPSERVSPVILPGSFVHGGVQFADGVLKLLAGTPNMRQSAMNCLMYPGRPKNRIPDLAPIGLGGQSLTFSLPEPERYPGLFLCLDAARRGGVWPLIVLAGDQTAVDAFLAGQIGFNRIAQVLGETLASYDGPASLESLDDRLALYASAGAAAQKAAAGNLKRWSY